MTDSRRVMDGILFRGRSSILDTGIGWRPQDDWPVAHLCPRKEAVPVTELDAMVRGPQESYAGLETMGEFDGTYWTPEGANIPVDTAENPYRHEPVKSRPSFRVGLRAAGPLKPAPRPPAEAVTRAGLKEAFRGASAEDLNWAKVEGIRAEQLSRVGEGGA